ncbi:MAG: hypothetical protein M9887_08155 [Chitinophagales bacterium]|nr:hypothetical protein [Chitinophagales bacterium]
MELSLLAIYSFLFLTFVYKSKRFKTETINSVTWVFLAITKIFVALSYNWLHKNIPVFFDSDTFMKEADIIFSAIHESPLYYLQLVFGPNNYSPEPEHLHFYIDKMGYWHDSVGYTIMRINALFRLISFGYISVHFLFFSILSFIGTFYLFKFFEKVTDLSEYAIIAILFFVPDITFWTSGLHKEALVLFAVGISIYNMYMWVMEKSKRRLFLMVFLFLFLINVRLYLIVFLLPAFIAFYWNEKNKKIKAYIPYIVVFTITFFSVVAYDVSVPTEYRLATKITEFQNSFINNSGNTSFAIDVVSNSWRRILFYFPQYVFNTFRYPIYNQCVTNWCRLSAIESFFLMVFVVIGLYKTKYKYILNNPIALFCLCIGFSWMSIIGVVVNNAGAIVRYRSVAIIFILIGFFVSTQKKSKCQ